MAEGAVIRIAEADLAGDAAVAAGTEIRSADSGTTAMVPESRSAMVKMTAENRRSRSAVMEITTGGDLKSRSGETAEDLGTRSEEIGTTAVDIRAIRRVEVVSGNLSTVATGGAEVSGRDVAEVVFSRGTISGATIRHRTKKSLLMINFGQVHFYFIVHR